MRNPIELVRFLEELAQNNNRDWFEANRPRYQTLRAEWTDLIQQVILALAGADPALEELSAERSLFRIHRDVRFSKEKQPYKTRFSASLSPGGKDLRVPGYYTQISEQGTLATGAGFWRPEPQPTLAIRTAISTYYPHLRRILDQPALRALYPAGLQGERLQRAPKGFADTDPALDLLKLKSFTLYREWPITAQTTEGDLVEAMVSGLALTVPLVQFLREAVGGHGA